MNDIAGNIQALRGEIVALCAKANRAPDSVTLVAVSKKQEPERLQAALEAGQRIFGENRVQEAQQHWGNIRNTTPDLHLHLIGPLQTNKVKQAVELFDVIESLDRPKLARALAKEMKAQKRNLPCFIQVNTGEEEQKAGVTPAALPAFLKFCRKECTLNITGLMCIPPVDEPPALHFALLAKLARESNLPYLSMGMSGDYQKAIALGATHIRVGTALFGTRIS